MAPGTCCCTCHCRGTRRRADAAFLAAAALMPGGTGSAAASCGPRFVPPKEAPTLANRYNGIGLNACFTADGPHHVFVISDWGGQGDPPVPVDHRGKSFPGTARDFVRGVDNCAQQRVAEQMKHRAVTRNPDYILNAGDNFYWGGIQTLCGARPYDKVNTGQWGPIFEKMYQGPGMDGKQWLGVLGNHDYGGFTFAMGWDQAIGYTWGGPAPSTNRWMTPAQYWSANVRYANFSVDYYFMDTNVYSAFNPHDNPDTNLCSVEHTPKGASCGQQGPLSVWDCPKWFKRLWRDQMEWIQRVLPDSTADWQVVVTHFPPTFGRDGWERLSREHGLDLIITGHVHRQEVHYLEPGNFVRPTCWLVSGGGGGITSEGKPNVTGADDQYGFFDLTLTKEAILVEAISHGGQVRSSTKVLPRETAAVMKAKAKGRKEKHEETLQHPKNKEEHEVLHRNEGHEGDKPHQQLQPHQPPALEGHGEGKDGRATAAPVGGLHAAAPGEGAHRVAARGGAHGSAQGSERAEVGMLAGRARDGGARSSATQSEDGRTVAHPDRRGPRGLPSPAAYVWAAVVALVALAAAVGLAVYRLCCRDRCGSDFGYAGGFGCWGEPGSSASHLPGWWGGGDKESPQDAPGYSYMTVPAETIEDAGQDDTDDKTVIVVAEEPPTMVLEEFEKPQKAGCMCWPRREGEREYAPLQPA
uniref:Calcineurin-like phosphoesterase domain-containing protein n=1 Tax=Pyrodinium bahamense TaxID=73915 RepID=A0A7S0A4V5_9DINO|mmetsp:Transcript_22140/g.61273  ORF Transcript_22140/g.61273 Transcript_22140/m.61273 type:complete len:695 (+) Transcript_22140:3-2087(+)